MMNCEGICWFVVEEFGLLMLLYVFVDLFEVFSVVVVKIGMLCVVKFVMLLLGKG